MDNTHILLMIGIIGIFSVIGLTCGIIIHEEAPKYIQDKPSVKNSFILLIVSLVFVVLFCGIYFSWHMLHTHKVKAPRNSTKMK